MQTIDANNPLQAILNNVNAYRPALLKEGYSNEEINNVIKQLSLPFLNSTPTTNPPAPSH